MESHELHKRSGIAGIFGSDVHAGFAGKAARAVPPKSSVGPGAMPESEYPSITDDGTVTVVHVQSLREANLVGSRRLGPFTILTVKFKDDGSVKTAASDEFVIRPFAGSDGSITPTFPKTTRGNLAKSASRYKKGQRVRCSDGRVGTVRDDTRAGTSTTIVDFFDANGTGMAILRNHEIISLA